MSEGAIAALIAILATVISVWGIISQRQITRRKSTLDLIARLESDRDIIKAKSEFLKLGNRPEGLAQWASADNKGSEEAQTIRLLLNQFELVSIGIQKGVIDGDFWKLWYKSGTVRTWDDAEPFVKKLRERTGNAMSYHEFEELAKALRQNKTPKRNWWLGRFF